MQKVSVSIKQEIPLIIKGRQAHLRHRKNKRVLSPDLLPSQ